MSARLSVAVLALMLSAPVFAATWRSIPADSLLEFVVTFEGAESTGRFRTFEVALEFDPALGTASALRVTVDVRSATMFSAELDEAIAETTWFNSAVFPEAGFVSSVVRQTGKQEYRAQGKVTIKGIEQALNLLLNLSPDGDRVELNGNVTLSRMDFGIGTGEWESDSSIGHAVEVRFRVILQRVD